MPIDSLLLGKITFARFLQTPLSTYERLVESQERSDAFAQLRALIHSENLAGALVDSREKSRLLGRFVGDGEEVRFYYSSHCYVRQYRLDEPEIDRAVQQDRHRARLVRKLKLINSRNRLTHDLITVLLREQYPFLVTLQGIHLNPLPQSRVAQLLAKGDAGQVSRLLRHLTARLPSGAVRSLKSLCPSTRQVHYRMVEQLVRREKGWLAERVIEEPLTDEQLSVTAHRCFGVTVSRRTVAYVRQALGIPDARARAQTRDYFRATSGFSTPLPMNSGQVRARVPAVPGVYEIWADLEKPSRHIVYIGSAGDLRTRLADHISGRSRNRDLHRLISEGRAHYRFRPAFEEPRKVEKELYRLYCDSFGTPPVCNRISP